MLTRPLVATLAALALAGPATAQETTYRLSPEAIAETIETASHRPEAATNALGFAEGERDNRIHGEVGFMIGTGGARGIYGTALIPLGESGSALVSVESSQYPMLERYGSPGYGYGRMPRR